MDKQPTWPWDTTVTDPDNPEWFVRLGEGLRAISNRDPLVAATCPFCGNHPGNEDHEIRMVEAIETYRPVVTRERARNPEHYPEGHLVAYHGYDTGEGYDDGYPGSAFRNHWDWGEH
jgi:hypothetical protein